MGARNGVLVVLVDWNEVLVVVVVGRRWVLVAPNEVLGSQNGVFVELVA
jgi:hypothetical protein